jgi:hypothetical protein
VAIETRVVTKTGRTQANQPSDHSIVDERTVSLDTGQTKVEKTDYTMVKQKL